MPIESREGVVTNSIVVLRNSCVGCRTASWDPPGYPCGAFEKEELYAA